MSGLVQLGAVQVGGEGHGTAVPELLLVAQTNLENERCLIVIIMF